MQEVSSQNTFHEDSQVFDESSAIVEQFMKLINLIQASQGVMTWENAPSMLTVEQAAKLLQLGENKTYRLCNVVDFPVIRFGKSFRIPKELLRKWVNEKAITREIVED